MTKAACLAYLCLAFSALFAPAAVSATADGYVGGARCTQCHADSVAQWRSSPHARSMAVATPQSVLGHFDAETSQGGVPLHLSKKNDDYWAHAQGPDGKFRDYLVRYTFGFFPLQQYLVELSGGRLQALGAAWDSRDAAAGGQRWYDLNPEQKLAPDDPLHWSGANQNWNFMCADCHSTGVRRNYDLKSGRYATRWTDINVSCEACHGPGSRHLAWAKRKGADADRSKGLLTSLRATRELNWTFSRPEQTIASPSGAIAAARREADVCFPCHSRRQPLIDAPTPGKPFLDNYLPSQIEKTLYHADGQIDGEVFEFASFAQSAMYRAGVSCSNCHVPHTLKLRASGNTLCAQCHRADHYDQTEHHHHSPGGEGAQCINCHMPDKTYMGVDQRRDHSLRIPRPDLSVSLGTPNACTQCHAQRSAQWAADAVGGWLKGKAPREHFAPAIDAAWQDSPAADRLLSALVANEQAPAIARGSALAQSRDAQALLRAVQDADPLVRLGAAKALENLPPQQAAVIGAPLLRDSTRSVRVEAARALTGVPLAEAAARSFQFALAELLAVERASVERPESHVNLARINARQGRVAEAERELELALKLDQRFVPALLNLADLYREQGQDARGEQLLLRAISVAPENPEPLHALGLLKVRQGKRAEALDLLARAVSRGGSEPRYAYVHALALADAGTADKALVVIEHALLASPRNASLLEARIVFEQRLGLRDDAARHRRELQAMATGKDQR